MKNKDIVFFGLLVLFFFIGIYVAFCTTFNVFIYDLIIIAVFAILGLFKKFNNRFNNWLENNHYEN